MLKPRGWEAKSVNLQLSNNLQLADSDPLSNFNMKNKDNKIKRITHKES